MKVFFEGYYYSNKFKVDYLDRFITNGSADRFKLNCVGYINTGEEVAFILPKIFIQNGLYLNQYQPEEIIENLRSIAIEHKKFLYSFSTTLLLANKEYIRRRQSILANELTSKNITSSLGENEITEIEVILSLIKFLKEGINLIKPEIYNRKSNNYSKKINWSKTLRFNPLYINNNFIFDTIVEKKQLLKHPELLELLNIACYQINQKYDLKLTCNRTAVKEQMKRYLRPIQRLNELKNKTFVSNELRLIAILELYFTKKNNAKTSINKNEYLVCKNFNLVFEDMIDKLLEDTPLNQDFQSLKHQDDGKIIDHIFLEKSVFEDEDIYFVGDSKYYKDTTSYSKYNNYKQITYTKNIIQYCIDIFNDTTEVNNKVRYRDEVTEGYNISPNFFIQGKIFDLELNSNNSYFNLDNERQVFKNLHFKNRLFDRDTVHAIPFHINFLFVINHYIKTNQSKLLDTRSQVKLKVRSEIVNYFSNCYSFYKLGPLENISDFIQQNFKLLNGKIFTTQRFAISKNLILALDNSEDFNSENQKILDLLSNAKIEVSLLILR